jgi:hypothetical protein
MKRALGLVAVLLLAGCGGPSQQPVPTGALATDAADRATRAVAAAQPDMNCKARAFGLEPSGATGIDEVTTIYAWAFCRDKHGGTAEMVPAAIDRAGTVRIPPDDDWAAAVKRIFPADVRDAVYHEPKSMADLAS